MAQWYYFCYLKKTPELFFLKKKKANFVFSQTSKHLILSVAFSIKNTCGAVLILQEEKAHY